MVVRPPATDVSFILRYIYVRGDCFLHSGSWILSGFGGWRKVLRKHTFHSITELQLTRKREKEPRFEKEAQKR